LGKKVVISDLIFAMIGIVVPVVIGYLISLFRKREDERL
jgi:hypothetical protein